MRLFSLVTLLALFGGGLAFAGGSAPKAVESKAADPKAVDANLARWNALEVVTAEALVWDLSEYTGDCYGVPCGAEYTRANEIERAESAERLARLDAIVEVIAANPPRGETFDRATVDADVDALRRLEIVSFQDFVQSKPVASGNCYGPCDEDLAAARQRTADRAALLHQIAEVAVYELGPEPGQAASL